MFFRVRQHRIPLVEHPEAWVRILFISNVGSADSERIERIAIEASAQNADIALFGGGYVRGASGAVTGLEPFASIRARLGKYFVLGGSDYLDDPASVRSFLRTLGIRDLTNTSCSIAKHGRVLELSGVDDAVRGIPTFPVEIQQPLFPRLVFSHCEIPLGARPTELLITHTFKKNRSSIFVVELGI